MIGASIRLTLSPTAFRPERWLGEGGLSPGSAKRISMAFGAGPRICPGRYLALHEMKMVLLTLLTRFDIDFVGTEDGSEPAERLMFTMAPVGLRMRLALPAAAQAGMAPPSQRRSIA